MLILIGKSGLQDSRECDNNVRQVACTNYLEFANVNDNLILRIRYFSLTSHSCHVTGNISTPPKRSICCLNVSSSQYQYKCKFSCLVQFGGVYFCNQQCLLIQQYWRLWICWFYCNNENITTCNLSPLEI